MNIWYTSKIFIIFKNIEFLNLHLCYSCFLFSKINYNILTTISNMYRHYLLNNLMGN